VPEVGRGRGLIYVDMDDVLGETTRVLAELINHHFDRRVPFDEIPSFDLARSFDLSAAQHEELMRLAHRPETLGSIRPMEGAVDVIRAWSEAGYAVAVVTGRPASAREVTRAWLEEHRVPHASLWFVDKYGRPDPHGGTEQPLPLAELERHEFALAVEDSAEMSVHMAGHVGVRVALLDRPWNRSAELDPAHPIVRCRGWSEIAQRFPEP
jgi:uncharacterized HAD superfamily protein